MFSDIRLLSLPDPCSIQALPLGREKREALHRLVHAFRKSHVFREFDTAYEQLLEAQIARLDILADDPQTVRAIETLSRPTNYAEIRQGGALNSQFPPLNSGALTKVCQEIKAALVWRAEIDLMTSQPLAANG